MKKRIIYFITAFYLIFTLLTHNSRIDKLKSNDDYSQNKCGVILEKNIINKDDGNDGTKNISYFIIGLNNTTEKILVDSKTYIKYNENDKICFRELNKKGHIRLLLMELLPNLLLLISSLVFYIKFEK